MLFGRLNLTLRRANPAQRMFKKDGCMTFNIFAFVTISKFMTNCQEVLFCVKLYTHAHRCTHGDTHKHTRVHTYMCTVSELINYPFFVYAHVVFSIYTRENMWCILNLDTNCTPAKMSSYTVLTSPGTVQEYPPFSCIGVDYAGPLFVWKPDSKVWISLYTCCGTQALHIDEVLDMTSDSFIWCLKWFMAWRGTPLKIISDNTETFKSAIKELDQIQRHSAVQEFDTS